MSEMAVYIQQIHIGCSLLFQIFNQFPKNDFIYKTATALSVGRSVGENGLMLYLKALDLLHQ